MLPAEQATLHELSHLLRLGLFAGFVTLGLRVMWLGHKRRAINHLLLYVVAVHLLIALFQNDAWPFSVYPLMAYDAREQTSPLSAIVFRAVDDQGMEWGIERLAWSPLPPTALSAWYQRTYPLISESDRREAFRFLLDRAEAARQHSSRHSMFYGNQALLGPLAARDIYLHPDPPQSSRPYSVLRVYRVSWLPIELAATGHVRERQLITEHPR